MRIASDIARPKLIKISGVKPDLFKANPPFSPSAIKRYKERNLDIGWGISKLDLTNPANSPNIKNRMEGSSKFVINSPF